MATTIALSERRCAFGKRPFSRYLFASVATAFAIMLAVASPAAATPCSATSTECSASLDIISSSTIGTGSQGTVDLLVVSPTQVQVTVSLLPGVLFVNSGGPHTPFVYNLSSGLTGLGVAIDTSLSSSTPDSFYVATGSQSETPYGTFTNGIGYNGPNGGVATETQVRLSLM